MRRTLRRELVDRLPVQVNYTAAMGAKLARDLGVTPAELPARLHNHLLRLEVSHTKRTNAAGTITYDWWGAGWDTQAEGYWHAFAPLGDSKDLGTFAWPDPEAPGLLDKAERALGLDKCVHFAVPNFGFALFERAWALRGFNQFLMDLATDPG